MKSPLQSSNSLQLTFPKIQTSILRHSNALFLRKLQKINSEVEETLQASNINTGKHNQGTHKKKQYADLRGNGVLSKYGLKYYGLDNRFPSIAQYQPPITLSISYSPSIKRSAFISQHENEDRYDPSPDACTYSPLQVSTAIDHIFQ